MSNFWDRERLLRSTILAGFAAATMAAAPAYTQDNEEEEEEQTEEREAIVVTGSLLRRDEFTSAAPIQVITAELASLEGLLDTAEILQESSIAAGSTQVNTQFGGFIVNGGPGVNSVSLRGLGAQRTLTLFNGRRLGPAGVEGRVGAVDLNIIPQAVVQRIEILKDGASSIYGSDAVAGVINVITRTEIDSPELRITTSQPFESGGASYGIDGAMGWNFDRGFITLSAAWNRSERLQRQDRDYFRCPQDYVTDPATGARLDRIEANPTSDNIGGFKCFNSGVVNAVDVFAGGVFRLIADPGFSGLPGGNYFAGFRARGGDGQFSQACPTAENPAQRCTIGANETDTDDIRLREQDILPEVERLSVYLTTEYDLGGANFYGELLYNNRTTDQVRNRQFFPWSGNPAFFGPGLPGGNEHMLGLNGDYGIGSDFGPAPYARPIALIPFNTQVEVDYFYGVAGLNGQFGPNTGFLSDWSWDINVSHSISDGTYTRDTVDARNVLDFFDNRTDITHIDDGLGNIVCRRISDGSSCPAINYFSTDFMAGNLTDEEYAFLFTTDTGSTEFTQTQVSGIITGEAFDLPAGAVGIALGGQYRRQEIDDAPGPLSFGGNQWGLTSAVNTAGEDDVWEVFGEAEIPLLSGLPGAEEVVLNVSARYFDYKLYDADSVYKVGLNWAITPLLRFRGTYGTSYRAPGLYELYLGNQTGFADQLLDPCIEWGDSTNERIRTNCAADGIPDNYQGLGPSILSISGGGAGVLFPETSESLTFGFIATPTGLDLSVAVDYFDITVEDQVAQLGVGSIMARCYTGDIFPNEFCNLFTRDTDPTSPSYLNILEVQNNFVNINEQRTTGLDLTVRYEHETDFGDFTFDMQGTWTFDDEVDVFQGVDGFNTSDFNGTLGDPDFVANANLQFRRDDWTVSWFTDFVSRMGNGQFFNDDPIDFFRNGEGEFDALYKRYSEPYFQHGASVRYRGSDWTAIVGISNIFDEHPPAVSQGADTRLGNISLNATQFDLRGRSAFFSVSKAF